MRESFEATTFTKVESDGKIAQFKSIRIPKEKEMAYIIHQMDEEKNLSDCINGFLAEEGARFQKIFQKADVTKEIKEVSTLDNRAINTLVIGILNRLCSTERNLNITLFDSFIKKLLTHGINLDSPDKYNITPLYRAAHNGKSKIFKILIENGANVASQDVNGGTPLMAAMLRGNTGCIKLLKENGATLDVDVLLGYLRDDPAQLSVRKSMDKAIFKDKNVSTELEKLRKYNVKPMNTVHTNPPVRGTIKSNVQTFSK